MPKDQCSRCARTVMRNAKSLPDILCHGCRRVDWQCPLCNTVLSLTLRDATNRKRCARACPGRPRKVGHKTKPPGDPRHTYAYRQARLQLRAQGLPCWICRQPINYALKWPNPWSFTADHYIEIDAGGDPYDAGNLKPAHSRCNIIRGNYYQQGRATRPAAPERDW